mmetsp:Transcript_12200/g.34596  ORF Transcript_12200/g.34596 Transcript_12200/m.34596 type:complete len:93 (+) Transcript_12200:1722-2000(+)
MRLILLFVLLFILAFILGISLRRSLRLGGNPRAAGFSSFSRASARVRVSRCCCSHVSQWLVVVIEGIKEASVIVIIGASGCDPRPKAGGCKS